MTKHTTITIRVGEKQLSNTTSTKTYFSAMTPTNVDIPLSKVQGLRREWSRKSEDSDSIFESRCLVTCYEVTKKFVLKMLSIYTSIGHRKAVCEILLDIDPEAPRIHMLGYHGFGEFVGNARIKTGVPDGIEVKTLNPGKDTDICASGLIF